MDLATEKQIKYLKYLASKNGYVFKNASNITKKEAVTLIRNLSDNLAVDDSNYLARRKNF